ncbi:MAG: hypothetical protein NWR83_13020 [Salibacteraceae bacterium]|nr:hypothetical protein [Salibacteraceae bacterium]MDP4845379.1 hypothetical protein [Salibacteraceae bacterium]
MLRFSIILFSVLILAVACKRETIEIETIVCDDACAPFNNDGECDDGGEESISNLCKIGTDCSDCGERIIITKEKIKRRNLPDSLR